MATKSPHHTLRAPTDTSISVDDAGPPLTIVGRAPNTRNIEVREHVFLNSIEEWTLEIFKM